MTPKNTPAKDHHTDSRRRFLFKVIAASGLGWVYTKLTPSKARAMVDSKYTNIMPNVKTSFNQQLTYPEINPTAYVHPLASVIGNIYLGKRDAHKQSD